MSTRNMTAIMAALLLIASSLTLAHEVDHSGLHDHSAPAAIPAQHEDPGVRSLIKAFRRTGDDQYLDTAWVLLEPRLASEAADVITLVDAATVAQARHDFDRAVELTDRALRAQPGFDQAWLLRAAIDLVRGDHDQAEAACRQLRGAPALVAMTCRARVLIARDEHDKASLQLAAILGVVDPDSAHPDWLAWSLGVAGDASANSNPDRAIAWYEQSLSVAENVQVRAALVDLLLDAGQPKDAAAVIAAGHDALPLMVRRFIVAKRTGEAETVSAEIERADHQFRHWIGDHDWAHAREMARFYLDVVERPSLARLLARINLGLQREPEDLRLALRAGVCSPCAL